MGTRKPTQVLAVVAGLVALLFGLAGTHDFIVDPANRLLGGSLEFMIFLGPALVAGGIVALLAPAIRGRLSTDKSGDRRASIRGRSLRLLGGAQVLVSVALLALAAITGSEIIGFYSSVSLFFLAFPGVLLFLVGSFAARKRKADAA